MNSDDMERLVVGCCLLDKNAADVCCNMLSPDDFENWTEKETFRVVKMLNEKNVPTDIHTVINEIKDIEEFGGMPYFASLIDDVPSAASAKYYALKVKEHSIKRGYKAIADKLTEMFENQDSVEDMRDFVEHEENKLSFNEGSGKGWFKLIEESMNRADRASQAPDKVELGQSTGFGSIDAVTGGFRKGTLNILGARPAMGKTTLAMNMAERAARDGGRVLVFSLEMTADDLADRQVSAVTGIPLYDLERGTFSSSEWKYALDKAIEMQKEDIKIYDKDVNTVAEIKQIVTDNIKETKVSLVVIDYLQLLCGENKKSRYEDITSISRDIKKLALSTGVPFLTLSQLSRGTEARDDKRPLLSDLRDSGAIEQDADLVMFIHRDSYYEKQENPDIVDNEAEIIIAKNRRGSVGSVMLSFDPRCTRFEEQE